MESEKRRIQRMIFETPLPSILGSIPVALCDLSTTGARIEHCSGFLPGGTFAFRVAAEGADFQARARVTRCRLARSSTSSALRYECGLTFVAISAEAKRRLHAFLAARVEEAIRRPQTRNGM